jgi:hypothetical protein
MARLLHVSLLKVSSHRHWHHVLSAISWDQCSPLQYSHTVQSNGTECRHATGHVRNSERFTTRGSRLQSLDHPKIGRKRLLACGSSLMLICHVIFAGLSSNFSSVWSSHRDAGGVYVGFLFLYILLFGATWGPVPWIVPSEIFSISLRAKGVALSACSYWL